jgi:ankyrin repeat protein
MPQVDACRDFEYAWEALRSGDVVQLEELAELEESFPHGIDGFVGRRWITNAIDSESLESVRWMLSKGVDLKFRDDEGYTPLHSAIECGTEARHAILRALLEAGAAVNRKGINDWTPAHLAAARNDVESLKLLVAFGADLSIRTEIDDYATPLEEAKTLRSAEAYAYLASVA